MSFTTPCFVKITEDNKESLKDHLVKLGYKQDDDYKSCEGYPAEYLVAHTSEQFEYWKNFRRGWDGLFHVTRLDIVEYLRDYIDCGTNPDLFLAIAALRSDNDIRQWFTDGEHWILCTSYSFGVYWSTHECTISLDTVHKATVSELITHFKNKEQ